MGANGKQLFKRTCRSWLSGFFHNGMRRHLCGACKQPDIHNGYSGDLTQRCGIYRCFMLHPV